MHAAWTTDHDHVDASFDLGCFDTLIADTHEDHFAASGVSALASMASFIEARRGRTERSSTLTIPSNDNTSSFGVPSSEASSLALSTNSILCDSPGSSDLDFTGVHYVESETPTDKRLSSSPSPRQSRLVGLEELHRLRDCLLKNAMRESLSSLGAVSTDTPFTQDSIGGDDHDDDAEGGEEPVETSFVAQLPPSQHRFLPLASGKQHFIDVTGRTSAAPSDCSMLSSTHTLSGEFGGVLPFTVPIRSGLSHLSVSDAKLSSMPLPRESVAVLIDAVRASTLQEDDKCRFVFDLFDADQRGVLSRERVVAFVEATLLANNLHCYGDLQVDELVTKLFANSQHRQQMTYSEFRKVFGDAVGGSSTAAQQATTPPVDIAQPPPSQLRLSELRPSEYKPSIHYRPVNVREKQANFWQRAVVHTYRKYDAEIHWLTVYAAAMLAAFIVKASRVAYDPAAGYAPRIAKGFAQVIMVDACFLLLPMCRNFVTFLRRFGSITSRVPIDKHIAFHKICGIVMLVASLGHVLAWLVVLVNVRSAPLAHWEQSAFHERLAFLRDETPLELLQRLPVWSGVVMTLIAVVAAPLTHATVRRGNFNAFWLTHLLFVPFLVLLLVHGLAAWVQSPQAFYWVLPPLVLYFIEKRYRMLHVFGGRTSIIRVHFSQDTVAIFMHKPANFHFHPGMYLYLNVPVLSRFEWHPFTISSAPEDDCLSIHVRRAGDWTGVLHDVLKTIKHERHNSATLDLEADLPDHLSPYPSIFIDGPVGAPSQDYYRYQSVVFVGAGIGVTPFASILRSIVHQWQAFTCPCCARVTFPRAFRVQKIYFYWVTREQEALTWFTETMNQLSAMDTEGRLEIHNYFSPLTRESVVAPLRALQTFIHDVDGHDIVSGLATKHVTHFGRPDWKRELERIATDHQKQQQQQAVEAQDQRDAPGSRRHEALPDARTRDDVAVFFCGPKPMGNAIHDECAAFNQRQRATDTADGVTFDFRSETF